MKIKNYTVDQKRLTELVSDKKQTLTEISQFQQHLLQEGIKQMLFGEGPVCFNDNERDLTEPMKQMLLDFKAIIPKKEENPIIFDILKMMNIQIVKDGPIFQKNEIDSETYLKTDLINLKKVTYEEFVSSLNNRTPNTILFIKDFDQNDDTYWIHEQPIK